MPFAKERVVIVRVPDKFENPTNEMIAFVAQDEDKTRLDTM